VHPSFVIALGALRGELWRKKVSLKTEENPELMGMVAPMVEVLALSR
jgi:hypothetical protein